MKKKFNALLIEDSEEDFINFKRNIFKLNEQSNAIDVRYKRSESLSEGFKALEGEESFDLIFLDLSLPDTNGLEGVDSALEAIGNELPIIVLTGNEDEETALEAIQKGAQDYIQKKEISPQLLSRSIRYTLERHKMAIELDEMRIGQAKSLKMVTLGEMAGGIAHEINNPLSVILGFADAISLEAPSDSKLHDYGQKIVKTTQRIAKIVKSLKAYSRKDNNDPMLEAKLKDIIEDTLNLCSEKFKTESIELIVDDIPDISLMCNDVQLSQVLLNLLNNAHDAVKGQEGSWVKISSVVEEERVSIFVSDCGKIIDEMAIKRLFTPFFTTKAKGKGTGLGLSISRNIIKGHDGVMEFVRDAEFTTFKIELPIKSKGSEQVA